LKRNKKESVKVVQRKRGTRNRDKGLGGEEREGRLKKIIQGILGKSKEVRRIEKPIILKK